MDEQTFLQTVADILEVGVDSVSLEANLDELGWDSLANITLIAEVDEKAGITLEGDALAEAVLVSDLYALVSGA